MKTIRLVFLVVLLSGMAPLLAQQNFEEAYRHAIKTSMYPAADTKDTNLIPIVPGNKHLLWKTINGEEHVLVVTWSKKNYYGKPGAYNTGTYQTWVTTAPELQQRMKKEKYTDAKLRLTQLLGLPPGSTNDTIVEFWVRPQDLFRPCPDREIDDKSCNICFGALKDAADSAYAQWINATRISRYYACGLYNQYPWTELGYTYDWNPTNKTHIGLCEFVIDEKKTIYLERACCTSEYLK